MAEILPYQRSFLRIYLPYALLRQPDGRYVVVNRLYKPVGMLTDEHVDYSAHALKLNMSESAAKRLSWNASADCEAIYLYNDGRVPTDDAVKWQAYQEKLQFLAKRQVNRQRRSAQPQ